MNGFRLAAKVVEDTRTGLETNIISGRRDLASIAQWKAQWKLEKVARGIYNVLVPRGQWEASVMKLDSEWRAKNGTGLLSGPRQYLHNLIAETFWRAKQMDRAGIECVNIIPNVERWDDGLRGKVTRATFENKLRLLAGHSDRLTLANPVAYIIACGTLLFKVSDLFNR